MAGISGQNSDFRPICGVKIAPNGGSAFLSDRLLGTALLSLGKHAILQLLRRVASRRRGRWEVSLVNAILLLLKTDSTLWQWLRPETTLDLEAALPNVS